MIFESVENITNKNFFIELVNVYIRLVEVTAERNNITIPQMTDISEFTISELIDMGLITKAEQISILCKVLSHEFSRFVNCVNFYITHKSFFDPFIKKLNNKERRNLQLKEQATSKPKFVDFFAGAGGLSCGFTQAGLKVEFANDFEEVCIHTYRFNHPEVPAENIVHDDIRKIVDNINDYIDSDIDIVVGGPPCQGFSSANQQRIIDDPRNELYKYFIKAVIRLSPKFVVMENVRGMMKVANQVVEDFENIKISKNGIKYSYNVAYRLLNSVNFGVAQSRERLIYIAVRNDVVDTHNITASSVLDEICQSYQSEVPFTLNHALEAIKSLEAPRIKNTNEIDSDISGKKIDVNLFQGNENEYLVNINNNREVPFLFNHKARYVNDINYDIYRLLNQGDDASDEKISGIMPYTNRLHCFKDKYYKLIADKPSRTITAHLRMDCHSHIHPFQVRAITPREAARIQSFPDDYLFLGAYLKTYMQIGNAVPCLMAKGIANIIKRYI